MFFGILHEKVLGLRMSRRQALEENFRLLQGVIGIIRRKQDMPHFPSRPWLIFFVKMEFGLRVGEQVFPPGRSILPEIPHQIDHEHRMDESGVA